MFSRRGGFHEEHYGSTIRFVIDPKASPPTRLKRFAGLEEGAKFLTWNRGSQKAL